jgi:hypothetical protein
MGLYIANLVGQCCAAAGALCHGIVKWKESTIADERPHPVADRERRCRQKCETVANVVFAGFQIADVVLDFTDQSKESRMGVDIAAGVLDVARTWALIGPNFHHCNDKNPNILCKKSRFTRCRNVCDCLHCGRFDALVVSLVFATRVINSVGLATQIFPEAFESDKKKEIVAYIALIASTIGLAGRALVEICPIIKPVLGRLVEKYPILNLCTLVEKCRACWQQRANAPDNADTGEEDNVDDDKNSLQMQSNNSQELESKLESERG